MIGNLTLPVTMFFNGLYYFLVSLRLIPQNPFREYLFK